jgi:lipoprotein signal peptidase
MSLSSILGKNSPVLKLLFALIALVVVDQVAKTMAEGVVFNSGFFLGSLEWMSKFYRVFCTLALLALSITVTGLLQFLTWTTLRGMSYALLLLQAGFLGNGIDKLLLGQVRDFIPVPFTSPTLVLNVADLYLWIGMGMVLYFLWRRPEDLWPKNNLRGHWLVFPKSQMKMTGVLMLITTLVVASCYILVLAYLRNLGLPLNFKELTVSFLVFLGMILGIVFLFGIRWSHRVFGPFRAVERYLETHPDSRSSFKLRDSDENECVTEVLRILEGNSDRLP